FAGCGRHVEMVLGDVALDQRCDCAERLRSGKAPASAASVTSQDGVSCGIAGRMRSWLKRRR
ncbi:MAG TPA: hypothetical protein PLV68_05990, partial [Ilumatobacteraceae bacterium]|nr:hypothetical protein [Ilumatobacteraceae bacterium]